jgi:hypothetical protein
MSELPPPLPSTAPPESGAADASARPNPGPPPRPDLGGRIAPVISAERFARLCELAQRPVAAPTRTDSVIWWLALLSVTIVPPMCLISLPWAEAQRRRANSRGEQPSRPLSTALYWSLASLLGQILLAIQLWILLDTYGSFDGLIDHYRTLFEPFLQY